MLEPQQGRGHRHHHRDLPHSVSPDLRRSTRSARCGPLDRTQMSGVDQHGRQAGTYLSASSVSCNRCHTPASCHSATPRQHRGTSFPRRNGRPLVALAGPGQAGDAPMFPHLMRHLRVRRPGRGQARTRPDRVRGDKAYSSRAIRGHLRTRGIVAVIPEPADQAGHRKRRGSRGGRPPAFDPVDYRGATSSSAGSTRSSSGAVWPLVTTSLPSSTDQRSSCTL